ncbi:hypothetical protein JTE90_024368 [Oedothorax gibbosus]|uniref:Uncharacterized protein n=1 Tax=Oedothorax gibbosus TaxID=931172 RepID=A0AAV6TEN2_9ARAC|nr:hypothetical protein JTE90_024368 [Oedothorax gibbosus]
MGKRRGVGKRGRDQINGEVLTLLEIPRSWRKIAIPKSPARKRFKGVTLPVGKGERHMFPFNVARWGPDTKGFPPAIARLVGF